MAAKFQDRPTAGRMLAERLGPYRHRKDVLVLALPRGGVPVAAELARSLDVDLDILVVRKLGVPAYPEFAMGAIASGGIEYLDEDILRQVGIGPEALQAVLEQEESELLRREKLYRGSRSPPNIEGRIAMVVDDGMATGASMRVAVSALRAARPRRIVVAVPVAAREAAERVAAVADEFVCVQSPVDFRAVGDYYHDFTQTNDATVRRLQAEAEGAA